MEKKFEIAKYIESVGRKLVSEFEDARELGADPNAKGAGIESATRKQLESLLPSILNVGQGYIIDSYGNTSRQIDLVLFERNLCPVFSINESPESTYYPCEGVVAAIEIKSQMRKREVFDAAEKAISVRKLQRRFRERRGEVTFGIPTEGKSFANRRYGQIGETLMYQTFNPNESPFGDILTGAITGHIGVGQDTLLSYYGQMQRNAPDILISLETGICVNYLNKSNAWTNARSSVGCSVYKCQNPFSRLIAQLYYWFFNGKTASFESFSNYFWNENGG